MRMMNRLGESGEDDEHRKGDEEAEDTKKLLRNTETMVRTETRRMR